MATSNKPPTAAQIAKLRRGGARWIEIIEATGLKTSSTAFAAILARGGYDRRGLKLDGSGPQTSKARINPGSTTKSTADLLGPQAEVAAKLAPAARKPKAARAAKPKAKRAKKADS